MKIKLSDYIADFFVENGIKDVFTITGGGAMHLNDSFGHHKDLNCIYNHHEQACAMAAEAYARIDNKIAAVCVTTGPGGTNAITGVLGGYLDSIPMLIISGQVRYDTTVRSTGLNLRAMGDQEFDITKIVGPMTKYCEMVIDPNQIKYCLQKAIYIAKTGRPGPCWIDIPLNVQAAEIETDNLIDYDPHIYNNSLPKPVPKEIVQIVIDRLKIANRPVINAGNGIRIGGAYRIFRKVVEKLGVPVVTGFNSIDLMQSDNPLYCGRGGSFGDRAGNFAIQNCDLLISIGSRLSIRQVGYNFNSWARAAYVVMVDVDPEELKKPTLHINLPVWADCKDFLNSLNELLTSGILFKNEKWVSQCIKWRKEYPVVSDKFYLQNDYTNPYCFLKELSTQLPSGQITVVSNGTACVASSQAYEINNDQRFIINSAIASMGYGLPAAIGVCFASNNKDIVCIDGDGSIQMNLQELQTIIHNKLPIKIFIINNRGYHSIRMTQNNFFEKPLVGVGDDSLDISFPSIEKLATIYGYPYFVIKTNSDLNIVLKKILSCSGPAICEIIVSTDYSFEPKSMAKRLPNGKLISAPLEDLAPFLARKELAENMYIPLLEE